MRLLRQRVGLEQVENGPRGVTGKIWHKHGVSHLPVTSPGICNWSPCFRVNVNPGLLRTFHRAAGARSQRLSWNRAWWRGSPGARGEGGRRAGSAPGAGRSRAARVGYRVLAGMWEGGVWVFPSFSLVVAFMAGNAHFVSLQEARLPCLP